MADRRTDSDRVLQLADELGVFRLADAKARGIHHQTVYRLVDRGLIERVGRGLYRSAKPLLATENHDLVLAAQAAPKGVVCLLSALQFHDLTTQIPSEVWMAIGRRAAEPRIGELPVRFVRYPPESMALGVEEHVLEGVRVKIFSAPKTVVDCFRQRNKVGFDVALEALRDCRRANKCSPAQLWDLATKSHVWSVMRPYIEAVG